MIGHLAIATICFKVQSTDWVKLYADFPPLFNEREGNVFFTSTSDDGKSAKIYVDRNGDVYGRAFGTNSYGVFDETIVYVCA